MYSVVFITFRRHHVLMQHLVLTLQQSQSLQVLNAVQQLVSVAVERVPSATDCKLSVINGEVISKPEMIYPHVCTLYSRW